MFNVYEDDAIMAEFDRISAEPIDDEPYSLVHNPKPVVESILDFNGHKIDTGSWCSGEGVDETKKKVGKAKTASDPKLTKAAPKSTNEKKEDGKIVENDTVADKKKKEQIVEVNADAEVKAKTPADAGKGSSFDTVAKSAASSNQKDADKEKKFEESCKKQNTLDDNIKLFKKGVKSLVTDKKTAADAEKVLKRFDQISSYLKPKTESVDQPSVTTVFTVRGIYDGNEIEIANKVRQLVMDFAKKEHRIDDDKIAAMMQAEPQKVRDGVVQYVAPVDIDDFTCKYLGRSSDLNEEHRRAFKQNGVYDYDVSAIRKTW